MLEIKARNTALLIGDMQNGFIHPRGCYARGGASSSAFQTIVPAIRQAAEALRAAQGLVLATLFTLVPGRDGLPLISPHLARLRPFLTRGDFAPGSFDHQVIDELLPVHCTVEKVAYSAFYSSRLDFVLQRNDIDTVICCGVVTHGGVASTARDAHTRGYHTIVLEDGCAAPRIDQHEAAIADLRHLVSVVPTAQLLAALPPLSRA